MRDMVIGMVKWKMWRNKEEKKGGLTLQKCVKIRRSHHLLYTKDDVRPYVSFLDILW